MSLTTNATARPAAAPHPHRPPDGPARAIVVATALVVLQAVVLLLFAWPNARLAPRDLPVVLAGEPRAVAALEQRLADAQPGAFEVTVVADEAAARAAVLDREAYGGVVAGADGATVLTASGASATVAQLLEELATGVAPSAGEATASGAGAVEVLDVAPGAPDDPRGVALASSMLPLVLTGMLCGLLLTLAVTGPTARLVGVVAFALLGGVVATAIIQGFLGALSGPYWSNAGAVALLLLAIGATVAGLGTVLGRVGLGLGAATMFLLGNPLSAIASAPELLPTGWGALGQLLPPGAGGSLLRSTAFFDGAGATTPLVVLVAWALAGVVLLTLGAVRRPRRV